MVEFLNMNSFLAQPAQHIKKFILSYLFFSTTAVAWCKILKKDGKHEIRRRLGDAALDSPDLQEAIENIDLHSIRAVGTDPARHHRDQYIS